MVWNYGTASQRIPDCIVQTTGYLWARQNPTDQCFPGIFAILLLFTGSLERRDWRISCNIGSLRIFAYTDPKLCVKISLSDTGQRYPSSIELSFDLLSLYLESDAHKSHNAEAKYTYAISDILIFMASKGLCTQGLGWYPYFKMHGKVLRMQNLSESQIGRIKAFRSESLQFPSEEFARLIPDFMERYHSTGYSRSACKYSQIYPL